MPTPADLARQRIATLKAEIADLERFLAIYDKLVDELGREPNQQGQEAAVDNPAGNKAPQLAPVDNLASNRRRAKHAPRPDSIADSMERIISDVGRPMTRGEIVEALERRDVLIPYQDKARYIGTIAWRHKARFPNVEGRGYWLADRPVPPIPLQPVANALPADDAEARPRRIDELFGRN